MDEIKETERRVELLKARGEEKEQELSIEQKKALIAEAKRQYGHDWKKMLGGALKHLKVNRETLQTLHSLGMGGQELRDMSNPAMLRKLR